MTDVSSWFIDQINNKASEPIKVFTMADSDHSSRVSKWPTISKNVEEIKPVNISVNLSNVDGLYNEFYEQLYTLNASCHLDIGFTHPTSGNELVRLYTGTIEKVSYSNNECIAYIKDKTYDISLRKIGNTDEHVDFASQIPSDIAWTLCTCYGGLSDVTSTSNVDIDYTSFNEWAATFSADSVVTTANFQGELVVKGLQELMQYTDSFNWVDGDGKLVFQRFTEASSLDFLVNDGEYKKFSLDINAGALVNKQYVSYNYSVGSEYWQTQASDVDSTSVNSFRQHDHVIESKNVWYTDSNHAENLATRRLTRLKTPPKNFTLDLPLFGIHREPGNTLRIVNSFYNVSSSDGWRVSGQKINLHELSTQVKTNEALVANAFYLDVSELDGDDLLL